MRKILLPPVMLTLCLLGIFLVNYYRMAEQIIISGPLKSSGYLLIIIGLFLPAWGAYLFRRHKTNLIPHKSPDHLVLKGPFRLSRNPMYLGMLLILSGFAVLYGTGLSFIFPLAYFSLANWWYIPFEEQMMQDAFGDEFTSYKRRVRRWL